VSWEVGEEEWLVEPSAIPGSGPIDAFDERVMSAMPSVTVAMAAAGSASGGGSADLEQAREPEPAPDEGGSTWVEAEHEASDPAGDARADGVPPPPHSAAFDEQQERPSYESGSFVADVPAPADAPAQADLAGGSDAGELSVELEPNAAEPNAAEPSAAEPSEDTEGFHIPTLSLGAQAPAEAAAPEPAPPVEPPAASEEADAGFVIPTLSRPADEAPSTVAESVYDDEDELDGQPEALERVDSSELELVEESEPNPEPETDFVIPTLARPEGEEAVEVVASVEEAEAQADAEDEPEEAAVVIPSLTRAQPVVEEAEALETVVDDEQAEEVEAEEVEAEEVEAEEVEEVEAIESLDTADLVEVEQAGPVEEAKPPTPPPEAKPQAKAQPKRRKAWYDDVFAEHFLFLFPPTWEETAARDAQFIFDQLGLSEGGRVLDVGCGDGRHAVELAKLGLQVTGLDNSLALLLAAAQTKEAAGIEENQVEFMHGDMRRLPRDREFDAVMCVGTTFGYFEEEQNRQCLQEMYDRVAVGGRLLLHVFNRDFVAPHLPSRSWWQGKRCMVIDEAEMNFFANRLRVHRTVIFDDGRQYEHYMFMRAYTVQDLGKAMSQMGMRVLEVSGSRDTRGRFYGSTSPDIWIVAEKK
jgi:SAM-dependent methyltransferase